MHAHAATRSLLVSPDSGKKKKKKKGGEVSIFILDHQEGTYTYSREKK